MITLFSRGLLSKPVAIKVTEILFPNDSSKLVPKINSDDKPLSF